MTLQSAADLIDVSIQRISAKMTNLPTGAIERLYHSETTEDYYDKDSSLTGFREASRMTENVIIASDVPIQGLAFC